MQSGAAIKSNSDYAAAGTRHQVALEVRHLHKSFGGIQAVRDVSFRVQVGEIVGLIGPNGSGKTTVLNLLAGYHRADAGEVILFGHDVTGLSANQVARKGMLRTWQDPRAVDDLTVRQNVALGMFARGRNPHDGATGSPADIDALLRQFHIQDCADIRAGELPYGRQKIVSLARTFSAQPRFLLLDEPLAGLSKVEIAFVFDIIGSFRTRGTVVIVDHAFGSLSRLSDRVIVLNSGQKLIEGLPAEVAKDPVVREVYFGHH